MKYAEATAFDTTPTPQAIRNILGYSEIFNFLFIFNESVDSIRFGEPNLSISFLIAMFLIPTMGGVYTYTYIPLKAFIKQNQPL